VQHFVRRARLDLAMMEQLDLTGAWFAFIGPKKVHPQ
jgi:hypothetical protein